MDTINKKYDEVLAEVETNAKRAFEKHKITPEGVDEYFCADPHDNDCSFHIIFRPGTIIIYGDVGDWILSLSCRDSFGWIFGSLSIDYVRQKIHATSTIRGDGQTESWYLPDAIEHIREDGAGGADEDEDENPYADLLEELKYACEEISHERFCEMWSDLNIDDYYQVGVYPSRGTMWVREILKWFRDNVEREST
jgi:hypothetical protein